jgi:hypothetical protein
MAFRKTAAVGAVTASATTTVGTIALGASYGRVCGAQVRNWASSAKAAAGTDALQELKLTDANGVIFYLDAADRDYKTATVQLNFAGDLTATGLGTTTVDSTGAAVEAAGGSNPIVQSPITVTVLNAGTATDYFEVYLYVEV